MNAQTGWLSWIVGVGKYSVGSTFFPLNNRTDDINLLSS